MKTTDQSLTDRRASICVAALALTLAFALSSCGVARQVDQAPAAQSEVSSRVKRALIDDESIDAAAIRVEADEDSVTLSGFVADEDERDRAVQAARAAAGDVAIIDAITIQR